MASSWLDKELWIQHRTRHKSQPTGRMASALPLSATADANRKKRRDLDNSHHLPIYDPRAGAIDSHRSLVWEINILAQRADSGASPLAAARRRASAARRSRSVASCSACSSRRWVPSASRRASFALSSLAS